MTDPEASTPGFAAPYARAPEGFGAAYQELENDSILWLIVGAVGFWFGLGWLTGPLAWYFASQVRSRYAALGRPASGKATAAWIIGIMTTLITYLAVVAVIMFFAFAGTVMISTQY